MSTLTIRNLDETVKYKLRQQAALHQRSMEAEAREILARGVEHGAPAVQARGETSQERMRKALDSITGIWAGRGSTGELMKELRGED
jgi:plasmid stability protein